MRSLAFAARNRKEILRDPLSIIFGIGFPVILILLISLMNQSMGEMPVEIFGIESFVPGMAVFGLSFLSLFLGVLIANDRSSSFLTRLFASPLTGFDYIIGYSLPLLPIAILQSGVCFATALVFGLPVSMRILVAIAVLIPVAGLFISLGLLIGSLFTGNQVNGAGTILINAAAWLSGTWFDLDMIGGTFRTVSNALPFAHAVGAVRTALAGDYTSVLPHLLWVIVYAVVLFFAATSTFKAKMKG